jgi:cytochrome c biogenesis protein CcdA/thiol-disulfide isomerase/thioredoxin
LDTQHLLNLGLAFLEGLALIVSPCILPVLPIVLSAGLSGGRYRPYGLMAGFVLSFTLLTLLSRKLVQWLGVDLEVLRQVSFVLLLLFGLILLSDFLSDRFAALTSRFAILGQRWLNRASEPQSASSRTPGSSPSQGFWSGLVAGGAIGLVWTPCAGPILAVVIVQTIRQDTDLAGALTVFAFGLGAALPMLLIILQGNRLMNKLNFLKTHSLAIRKTFGAIIVATVLLTAFGNRLFDTTSWAKPTNGTLATAKLSNPVSQPYSAPEFRGITAWINSAPLTMQSLRGKVVLIDFWTYSCINCVRTLPVLKAWDNQYRNQGLVIVGVHSPEFEFEKKVENVRQAVKEQGIHYPVAVDSNLDTWLAFNNQYWPAHYLIDRQGRVVYTHFGEGEYATTERNIRTLLGVKTSMAPMKDNAQDMYAPGQTPETYLGYARGERFSSPQALTPDQLGLFSFPKTIPAQHWSLKGHWYIDSEKIVAQDKNAALRLHFKARKVFLVMGVPPKKSIVVKSLVNGKPIATITVNRQTLYQVASLSKAQDAVLEIQIQSPGLAAYAFTFGN